VGQEHDVTSKVGKWARDRAAILERRRRLVTAALSTVTVTTVTAKAQICLSVAEPEPPSCAARQSHLKADATPRHWLAIGRCYEEQERNLDQALTLYEDFMARTEGQEEYVDDRARIQWKIGRIQSILAAERAPERPAAEPDDGPEPAPQPPPPDEVEVIPNPQTDSAPRTGGAASCGCETAGRRGGLGAGLAVGLGLAALARRRRRGPR